MKSLHKLLETLLYPIYTPIYAVLMLYFTATPYAVLPLQQRLFVLGTVVLYTIVVPKPLVRIMEQRFGMRMTRQRTHLAYAASHIACYATLVGIRGIEPITQVVAATILLEVLLPMLRPNSNSCSMTLGLLLSFITLMSYVGCYQGSLFPLLISTILLTGYVGTLQFSRGYVKRRQVLSSFMLGVSLLCITLLLRL